MWLPSPVYSSGAIAKSASTMLVPPLPRTAKTAPSVEPGGVPSFQLPPSLQLSEEPSPDQRSAPAADPIAPTSKAFPLITTWPPFVQIVSGSMSSTMSIGSSTSATLSMNVGSQVTA